MAGHVIERDALVRNDSSPSPPPERRRLRRAGDWVAAHPLIAIALLAFAVRFVAAAGIAIVSGGGLFGDDDRYVQMAYDYATGHTQGWIQYEHDLYRNTGSLLWPITGLFAAVGRATFLAQLYPVALGTATAVLTTKLGLYFLSRPAALLAGAIVALLPSQILWSSIVMKDPVVWSLLVGLAVLVVAAQGARGWRLAAYGVAAVAMGIALGYLRLHTLEIALVALFLTSPLGPAQGRLLRVAGTGAMLALLPLMFSMGFAGIHFAAHPGSLSERRAANAVGANTAIVAPTPKAPSGPASASASAPEPAKPADDSLLGYAPKGLTVVALRPFPWETVEPNKSAAIRLAGSESVIWYAMLALGLVGLAALRGRLRYLAFPLLVGGATAFMYGVTEGNLGTAYRHRGEFVWVVAVLAALGADQLARRRQAARRLAAQTA